MSDSTPEPEVAAEPEPEPEPAPERESPTRANPREPIAAGPDTIAGIEGTHRLGGKLMRKKRASVPCAAPRNASSPAITLATAISSASAPAPGTMPRVHAPPSRPPIAPGTSIQVQR